MNPLTRFPKAQLPSAAASGGLLRSAALAVVMVAQWAAYEASGQTLPLAFDKDAFLFKTYSVYTTNIPPGINWQSRRGLPISTNSADPGSDGRAPTVAQQIANGL